MGELVRPVKMPSGMFDEKQSKLCGINEHTTILSECNNVGERIAELTNLGPCDNSSPDLLRYFNVCTINFFSNAVFLDLPVKQ